MKALSILQPWPYAIFNFGKDIENRTWRTRERGRILIHAGKGFDGDGYAWLIDQGYKLPAPKEFQRGGVVGSVIIADCVDRSASKWFFGPYGFVLAGARQHLFVPYLGERGFFEVNDALVPSAIEDLRTA